MSCPSHIAKGAAWAPCWLQESFLWVHEHQVLVSATIAFFSAVATVFYIRRQIQINKENRQEDEERAVKTSLTTGVLLGIDICDYFPRSARHIEEIHNKIGSTEPTELWQGYGDTIRYSHAPREFSEREAFAFASTKNAPLLNDLIELRRAVIMEEGFWKGVTDLRTTLEVQTSGKADVGIDIEGPFRTFSFDPNLYPETALTVSRLRVWGQNYYPFVKDCESRSFEILRRLSSLCEKESLGFKIETEIS